MARRKVIELIQYDYTSKEEYLKHKEHMKLRGWYPTKDTVFEDKGFCEGNLTGSEKWNYTAYYYKGLL